MSDELRDPELSRLYREAGGAEPSPALDRAILLAARAAVAPRRSAWWQRWAVPATAFATVVLTVTVTLMVQREQDRTEAEGTPPAAIRAAPPALPPALPKEAVSQDAARAPAAARPQRQAERAVAPTPSAQGEGAVAPTPVAPGLVRDAVKESAPALPADAERKRSGESDARPVQPAAPASAPAPAPAPAKALAEEAVRPQAAPAAAGVGRSEHRAKTAPAGKLEAGVAAASARPPEAWLEEIRRLRREGREAEAAASLEAFRRAHPAFALPEDLR